MPTCRLCDHAIPNGAVYCRHCSEPIKDTRNHVEACYDPEAPLEALCRDCRAMLAAMGARIAE